jgi:hypothetical protein
VGKLAQSKVCLVASPCSDDLRQKVVDAVDHGERKGHLLAPLTFKGYCDTTLVETWVEQLLVPALQPGQVVVLDNASFHKSDEVNRRTASSRKDLKLMAWLLSDETGPLTNNSSKQALRWSVVFHKITYGFRSDWGQSCLPTFVHWSIRVNVMDCLVLRQYSLP